jgi:hypothetical protein
VIIRAEELQKELLKAEAATAAKKKQEDARKRAKKYPQKTWKLLVAIVARMMG